MVVKNSLKSETIESLSYKLSQMDTNVYFALDNMLSNLYSGDAETSASSNKIVVENSFFKLNISGSNFNSYNNFKISSIKFLDKQSKTEIEIKGNFSLDYNWKFTSASITSIIDGEKITLKQTFDDFVIDAYSYNYTIGGVKWTIIDGKGGFLEINAGDLSLNEYGYFDSWSLEDIILDVDPSYDFSQTSVVSHPDMKFAVMSEKNDTIKITSNNIGEFETNSNGDLEIEGLAGNDKITGTSGNDYIDGGDGADSMNGRMGDDTYIVDNVKDMVKEAANQGNDTIITTLKKFSLAKLTNVENLTYEGSVDADLTGNKQDNIIKAGDGHDNLYGGLGNDILTGGAGEDAFVFNTKLGSSNVDIITDFVSGEDWLSLDKKLFKKLAKSFTEDNLVYGDKALDNNDYLIFNSDNNTLYYDADGSGTKASAVEIVVVGTMIDFNDIVVEY